MKKKNIMFIGILCLFLFIVWTYLIQKIDVQPLGVNGTDIGFATINHWFHQMTGGYMSLYFLTDWLGLVPVFVCMLFGMIGLTQFIRRKNLLKVDYDIIFLGIYYIIVIFCYLLFEMVPINYRPVLINGFMEASYPSSTTLLVLSVMPTLIFQADRRLKAAPLKKAIRIIASLFTSFMVIGRLISGVHWVTDIVGSILLSTGMFLLYKSAVLFYRKKEN